MTEPLVPPPPPGPDGDWKAKIEQFQQRIASDERFFIESCISITDRVSNKTIPFKFNRVQEWYEKAKSAFDFILKSRKLGMTSRIIAGDIHACAFKQNQHAVLIAHDKPSTIKLLEERVKPMIRSCKVPLGAIMRRDYLFFPKTNSRYYIGTAGTKGFGRGSDVTRYHLSEGAFYENPDVVTSIEEACLENAVGRLETTANGANFAQQLWKSAMEGTSRYKALFIPWYLDERYTIVGAALSDLTEDETKLVEAYTLDHGQLAWRRKKIKEMARPELFAQEYPSNSNEAFLSSGRMVFDWVALIRHEQLCTIPNWVGFLKWQGEGVEFQPQRGGNLHIWEQPQRGHHYVIGADVAEGLKHGAYSTAFVLDVNTSTQVAEWHGHTPPDKFADVLEFLGAYYNMALLVPESWPGPGAQTTGTLIQHGYRNVWLRPESLGRSAPEQRYGWDTNRRTRPKMLHGLSAAVRDYRIGLKSNALIDELRTMIYDDAGDMVPQVGCFSDRVIAAAIAWTVSRDVADGIHAGRPTLKQIENIAQGSSHLTSPKWRGPRYGVREA